MLNSFHIQESTYSIVIISTTQTDSQFNLKGIELEKYVYVIELNFEKSPIETGRSSCQQRIEVLLYQVQSKLSSANELRVEGGNRIAGFGLAIKFGNSIYHEWKWIMVVCCFALTQILSLWRRHNKGLDKRGFI